MLAEASRKDPEFVQKVLNLVEGGFTSDQIISTLQEDIVSKESKHDEKEIFPDEIRLISQAFAFRTPNICDKNGIYKLLNHGYSEDVYGDEAFHDGPAIDYDAFNALYISDSYEWLVMECPSGRGIIDDGTIVGVCCFASDGESRKNGTVEGKLGSVRFLTILKQLRGYCIGMRLIDKIEERFRQKDCCRSMICAASTRHSLHSWLMRRGYSRVAESPYPSAFVRKFTKDNVLLDLFVKELFPGSSIPSQTYKISENIKGKMNLPPIWRMVLDSSVEIPDVD